MVYGELSLSGFLYTLPQMAVPIVEAFCRLAHINVGCWMAFMYFLPHQCLNIGNSQTVQTNHLRSKFPFPILGGPGSVNQWAPEIYLASQTPPPPVIWYTGLHIVSRISRWTLFKLLFSLSSSHSDRFFFLHKSLEQPNREIPAHSVSVLCTLGGFWGHSAGKDILKFTWFKWKTQYPECVN